MRLAQKQMGTTEQGAISFAPWSCHFASATDRLGKTALVVSALGRDITRIIDLANNPEASSKTQLM